MDWYNFGLLLYDNIGLYLCILIVSLLLYFLIFRGTYLSFLDPLIFNLVYSVFGCSVVVFLYATHSIQQKYLYSYLFTQTAFFIGLFLFRPLNKNELLSNNQTTLPFVEQDMLIKILFLITSAAYVIIQLLSYQLVGIPVLLQSRIGAYADTGGLGILGRMIDVLRPVTIFMLIYFLFKPGKKFLMKFYLGGFSVLLVIFFALSGSKSLFMSMGFILFIYLLLNANLLRSKFLSLRKYESYILISGVALAFFTIFIQLTNDNSGQNSSINVFLYRLVASGDTYYFSYPNNNIELINGSKSFLALFGDIFSVIRVVPREDQPGVLGVQLFHMFGDPDLIAGPNARHNVFGYIYYGFYGSILFSFLIGASLSFVRNKLFHLLKFNILGQISFMFLYLNLTFIETDPPVAISGIENVLLIFPVFVIIALVVYVPVYNMKWSGSNTLSS